MANFLSYVNSTNVNGTTYTYNCTLIHRSLNTTNDGAPPSVIQGGGYTPGWAYARPGSQMAPITNEFNASNVAGTIAMALGPDINDATNQWFINTADNSSSIDGGMYTVSATSPTVRAWPW